MLRLHWGKQRILGATLIYRHYGTKYWTLDRQLNELDSRFQNDSYGIMKASAACLPRADSFGQVTAIQPPCTHYGISVEDSELTVFFQQLNRKVNEGRTYPSLTEVLDSCPKDIFPNVNGLLRAIITLPITSCTVERLFSTVNRIKTSNRASMLTGRLNNLSLLSFERELTESFHCSTPSPAVLCCDFDNNGRQ